MSLKSKCKTITALVCVTVSAVHVFNRLAYHIATIENLLQNEDELYYNSKLGKIFYSKSGSGKPLLLIHDLNVSSSSYEWNKIVNELSKTNTVYTIDLLGCGRSDKPDSIYTNYVYVSLITDFIKNVIGSKTDIVTTGHSSSILLMSCINDNAYIDKVILVNPENLTSLLKVPDKKSNFYRKVICTPIIGTFIYNILVNKKSIGENFRNTYYYDQNKVNDRDIVTYLESSHKSHTKGKYLLASIISGYTNANVSDFLKKIQNNIYIIIGTSNPENELKANQYQNLLSSIKIAGIDNTKDLPQLEKPDEFIKEVTNILDED